MAKDKKRYKRRGRRSKTRGFASWSLGKKIGAILGGTLVTVAAIGAVIVASKLSKINTVKLDTDKLSVSKEAKKRGSGYLNVALFGVDSRDNDLDKGTRSDTIMIASLNKKTMKVKIASIYRDTLSEQEDGTLNKINAAYSYGGPEGALSVLNKNLDMNIEHYVTVNFNSMIDVVDSVGGIDIDVQEDEMPYICMAGKFCKVLVGPALVVADDLQQALAHVGQPVIGRAGAHGLGGFRLDDLLGVADLGAGDAAIARSL